MTAEQRNHMLLCDPVSRVIPKLAVPTIISMLITNIYNMADTFFVSQLGTSASGAVGVIFSAMAIIRTSARRSARAIAKRPTPTPPRRSSRRSSRASFWRFSA